MLSWAWGCLGCRRKSPQFTSALCSWVEKLAGLRGTALSAHFPHVPAFTHPQASGPLGASLSRMEGGIWLGSNGEESLEPGPGGLGVGLSPPLGESTAF